MDLGGLRWVTRSLRKASWWKFLEHLEPFARHLKVWRPRRIFCHFLFMQVPSLISFIEFGYKCQTTHTLKQNIAAQKICYILIHHVTDTKIPLVCPGSIAFEGTMCFHFWWLRLHQGNRDKCISKTSKFGQKWTTFGPYPDMQNFSELLRLCILSKLVVFDALQVLLCAENCVQGLFNVPEFLSWTCRPWPCFVAFVCQMKISYHLVA